MRRSLPLLIFMTCLCVVAYAGGALMAYFDIYPAAYLASVREAYTAASQKEAQGAKVDAIDVHATLAKAVIQPAQSASSDVNLIVLRYQPSAQLIDMNGTLLHEWNLPFSKAFPHPAHINSPVPEANIYFEKATALPNGDLLATYTGWGDSPYGYGLVKMDKDSHVLWTYADHTHHDIFIHPDNGNVYAFTHRFQDKKLVDDINVLSTDGALIKKIPVMKAFAESPFAALLTNKQTVGLFWDKFHSNSIDVLDSARAAAFPQFKEGSILISIRNMNTLAVIDPESEQVVWAHSGTWTAQHSAHFTPRGTIILFDNNGGTLKEKIQSRILEINPATLALDVRFTGTAERPFHSYSYGRLQRLDGDHLLVTETLSSRVFELDASGNVVWDFRLEPAYQPRLKDVAPFGSNERKYEPDFVYSGPNLATAIIYAQRYHREQLSFLKAP